MRRCAVALLCAAALVGCKRASRHRAGRVGAAPGGLSAGAAELARHIPGGATQVVILPSWTGTWATLSALAGRVPAVARRLEGLRARTSRLFGVDLASPAGLQAIGIDPGRPWAFWSFPWRPDAPPDGIMIPVRDGARLLAEVERHFPTQTTLRDSSGRAWRWTGLFAFAVDRGYLYSFTFLRDRPSAAELSAALAQPGASLADDPIWTRAAAQVGEGDPLLAYYTGAGADGALHRVGTRETWLAGVNRIAVGLRASTDEARLRLYTVLAADSRQNIARMYVGRGAAARVADLLGGEPILAVRASIDFPRMWLAMQSAFDRDLPFVMERLRAAVRAAEAHLGVPSLAQLMVKHAASRYALTVEAPGLGLFPALAAGDLEQALSFLPVTLAAQVVDGNALARELAGLVKPTAPNTWELGVLGVVVAGDRVVIATRPAFARARAAAGQGGVHPALPDFPAIPAPARAAFGEDESGALFVDLRPLELLGRRNPAAGLRDLSGVIRSTSEGFSGEGVLRFAR